jgi:hypothetical protein
MANQARREQGRKRILAELAQSASGDAPGRVWDSAEPSVELEDVFYHAWASDLLQRSVQNVLLNLHAVGKGDYFRVLYGRLCEELSTREVAEFLEISAGTVENYFKAAKKLLAQELEAAVRTHVARYCPPSEQEDEYWREWGFLSEHLAAHGGLEQAIRQCHKLSAPEAGRRPLETSRRACGHWLTGVSSSGSQHGLE